MVRASLRMKFAPDKYAQARDILTSLVERTKVCPGCQGCNVCQDVLDPHVLIFEEWWETDTDLEQHLGSESYWPVILVMEMAAEQPKIRFDSISGSTGMETLEKARSFIPRKGSS